MNRKSFGYTGEKIACKFLIESNYKIVEQNFYYNGGEIDIIAFDTLQNELVFIEVKTRSNSAYGFAVESVDDYKINKIIRGARYYLHKKHHDNVDVRFDVIEIYYKDGRFFINQIKQII